MVLQKMVQQHRRELAYLGSQMNKPGYLDEVKSLVSEFMQYDIREENLAEMKEKAKDQPLLEMKLKDVGILYQSFREFLKGHYMTGEEVMDVPKNLRERNFSLMDLPDSRQFRSMCSGSFWSLLTE